VLAPVHATTLPSVNSARIFGLSFISLYMVPVRTHFTPGSASTAKKRRQAVCERGKTTSWGYTMH
jgi:hypothetical protein